jgi:tetratricopeptide (TPR) repeat protein
MTSRRKKIARRPGASRHFLLSQTDSRRVEEVPEYGADRARRALRTAFPDVWCGQELRQGALERLNDCDRFSVMVLRPDEAPAADGTDPAATDGNGITPIAERLEAVCRRTGAFWGIEDSGLLAGYWPNRETAECVELACSLQEEIRKQAGTTVTAGIAAYPTLDYPRQQILENARKAIDHAAFFGPGSRVAFDAVSLNISGDKYYERGDIGSAIREFEHALALDAGNVNVLNSLGVCHAVRGDYERALEQFSAALRLESGEYMAAYNIGLIHALLGRRDTALGFFLKANALRDDVFEILLQTGKLYLEMEQPQAARPFLEHASRLRAKSGNACRLLGDCYAAVGLPEKAIGAYKKAVKANPGDAMALSALGCLFDEKGENLEIAIVFCKESVRLTPDNTLFRRRLGSLYVKLNRLEEALEEFEQAGRLGYDAAEDIRRIRERMADRN